VDVRAKLSAISVVVMAALGHALLAQAPGPSQPPAAPGTPVTGPASGARRTAAQSVAVRKTKVRPGKKNPPLPTSSARQNEPPQAAAVKPAGPELSVVPAYIRFPAQTVPQRSGPQIVTLSNVGRRDLPVYAGASGDFHLDAPVFPRILRPGSSIVIAVSFRPRRDGAASGALTIWSNSGVVPLIVRLSGRTPSFRSDLFSDSFASDIAIAVALSLLYWLAMVVVRWQRVARSTRELLRAQIATLRTELATLARDPQCGNVGDLVKLLDQAEGLLGGQNRKVDKLDVLFWSRGQELTGWAYAHEVQVHMVPCLPDATVTVRLETAEQKLRATNDPPCVALANAIHLALTGNPQADALRRKALLAEALATNYDREDSQYADLVSWLNKTSWLVVFGLVFIISLTAAYPGHSVLLLVGALGGLLSRLSRSLDRKDLPTDYGASWTTLFLSPVAGSLGAWAGILLASLAEKAQVLGPSFHAVWSRPNDQTTLAIALLFGFSERLLDGILDKLTGKALGAPAPDGGKPPIPPPAPPPKPPAPPIDAQTLIPPPPPPPQPPALTITTRALSGGTVGKPYDEPLATANAAGAVKWSSEGALPDGLGLTADSRLAGQPIRAGTFIFTLVATDQRTTARQPYTITVAP
jgi:hypothetical protein